MTRKATRKADLKRMLTERRRQMQSDLHGRIRDGRLNRPNDVRDDFEHSDADVQGGIQFAMLQMRREMLARVDEALIRLDAGKYGFCADCEREIAARRLRALPFAVRCQTCQKTREEELGRARQVAQRRGGVSLFSDAGGS